MQATKLLERFAKCILAIIAAALLWRPGSSRRARQALTAPRRILLIRIDNRVGEALLTTPLLTTLKTLRPVPSVDILVHPRSARVLERHPDVDQVIPLERGLWPVGSLAREIRALRRSRYDLVFDCGNWSSPSVSSALIARLAAGKQPVIGPAVWPINWLHSLSVRPRPGVPGEVSQRLQLLSVLPGTRPTERISFRKPAARPAFMPFLEDVRARRFAVVNPGSRLRWRRIPAEVFCSAASVLLSLGIQPIITWGPGEEGLAADVASRNDQYLLAPSTDLDDLASLLELAALSVCNNTGPMHLSVAVGTPTLGLFVRMDIQRWGHHSPPHRMLDLTTEMSLVDRACERVAAQTKDFVACLERGRSSC